MTWNYRVVRYRDGSGFGLHEVFYDDKGLPWGMSEEATGFVCGLEEGAAGIAEALMLARTDSIRRPVLDQPETWPGEAP